jgi:polysaccharide biosynthesis transport protein
MNLSTLGIVPRHKGFGEGRWSQANLVAEGHSAFAEAVRGICTQLQLAPRAGPGAGGAATDLLTCREGRVVLVASALPDEGKTTLSLALALIGAPQLGRTLLVDGDLRRPAVARLLRLGDGQLPGQLPLPGFRLDAAISHGGVDVLADASPCDNPAARFAAADMLAFMERARRRYDWIIIDAPPVLGLPDVQLLARHADHVLLVGRWGQSTAQATRVAAKRLRQVAARGLAAVITDVAMDKHAGYYYGDEGQYYRSYKRYFKN